MRTPIEKGLYKADEEKVYEIARNPEPTQGWLAYRVRDVVVQKGTDGEHTRVLRAPAEPLPVTIELWMTLEKFDPKLTPNGRDLAKAAAKDPA